MNILSKKICSDAWHCHREIEVAEKLLEEVGQVIASGRNDLHGTEKRLEDGFGRETNLQLGVPMGDNARRLFNLSYSLAEPIIKAHIAHKKAQLSEITEAAKLDLGI